MLQNKESTEKDEIIFGNPQILPDFIYEASKMDILFIVHIYDKLKMMRKYSNQGKYYDTPWEY